MFCCPCNKKIAAEKNKMKNEFSTGFHPLNFLFYNMKSKVLNASILIVLPSKAKMSEIIFMRKNNMKQ